MLARLASVPTVYVRLAGRRDDPPHREAYRGAAALLAPFHALARRSSRRGRCPRRDALCAGAGPASAGRSRYRDDVVLGVVGKGGGTANGERWASAARATPGLSLARRRALHRARRLPRQPAKCSAGSATPDIEIAAAGIVVGAAGDGLVGAVIAARKRFVCIPEAAAVRRTGLEGGALGCARRGLGRAGMADAGPLAVAVGRCGASRSGSARAAGRRRRMPADRGSPDRARRRRTARAAADRMTTRSASSTASPRSALMDRLVELGARHDAVPTFPAASLRSARRRRAASPLRAAVRGRRRMAFAARPSSRVARCAAVRRSRRSQPGPALRGACQRAAPVRLVCAPGATRLADGRVSIAAPGSGFGRPRRRPRVRLSAASDASDRRQDVRERRGRPRLRDRHRGARARRAAARRGARRRARARRHLALARPRDARERQRALRSRRHAGVPDALLGEAGDYDREPRFTAGAWRFCAVQLGGIEALLIETRAAMSEAARGDPIQRARFADAVAATRTAGFWVREAADRAADEDLDAIAIVRMTRGIVERAGARRDGACRAHPRHAQRLRWRACRQDHPRSLALSAPGRPRSCARPGGARLARSRSRGTRATGCGDAGATRSPGRLGRGRAGWCSRRIRTTRRWAPAR